MGAAMISVVKKLLSLSSISEVMVKAMLLNNRLSGCGLARSYKISNLILIPSPPDFSDPPQSILLTMHVHIVDLYSIQYYACQTEVTFYCELHPQIHAVSVATASDQTQLTQNQASRTHEYEIKYLIWPYV